MCSDLTSPTHLPVPSWIDPAKKYRPGHPRKRCASAAHLDALERRRARFDSKRGLTLTFSTNRNDRCKPVLILFLRMRVCCNIYQETLRHSIHSAFKRRFRELVEIGEMRKKMSSGNGDIFTAVTQSSEEERTAISVWQKVITK